MYPYLNNKMTLRMNKLISKKYPSEVATLKNMATKRIPICVNFIIFRKNFSEKANNATENTITKKLGFVNIYNNDSPFKYHINIFSKTTIDPIEINTKFI